MQGNIYVPKLTFFHPHCSFLITTRKAMKIITFVTIIIPIDQIF